MVWVRRAFQREPWHYELSLWLLVAMLLVYVIDGRTSQAFVVCILVALGWFTLYGFVILCGILARADEAFWKWMGG